MNKRKASSGLDDINIVPNKLVRKTDQLFSFRNVFEIKNQSPFFSVSSTLPIPHQNNNKPDQNIHLFTDIIQYMPCNTILHEKYMMDNMTVFEIFN